MSAGLRARDMNADFPESIADGLDRLPPEPRHTRFDLWWNNGKYAYCSTNKQSMTEVQKQKLYLMIVKYSQPFWLYNGWSWDTISHVRITATKRSSMSFSDRHVTFHEVFNGHVHSPKVTNNTELEDAEVTWYSPTAIPRIRLYGLEHGFRIYSFRPTWSSRFPRLKWNFLNHLLWSAQPSHFA